VKTVEEMMVANEIANTIDMPQPYDKKDFKLAESKQKIKELEEEIERLEAENGELRATIRLSTKTF
jgi:septal ring factor EnvC (AmiA/AmiB activator)